MSDILYTPSDRTLLKMTVDETTLLVTIVGTGAGIAAVLITVLIVVLNSTRKQLAGSIGKLSGEISKLSDDVKNLGGDVTQVRERVSSLEGKIQVFGQLIMRPEKVDG